MQQLACTGITNYFRSLFEFLSDERYQVCIQVDGQRGLADVYDYQTNPISYCETSIKSVDNLCVIPSFRLKFDLVIYKWRQKKRS